MNARLFNPAQRGFALLEALVSVLVISLGLLPFAAIQMVSMSASTTSTQRTKAVYLTYEMIDRVRANHPAYAAGAYDSLIGVASDPGCVSTECSSAQIAQNDYYEWSSEVSAQMPEGQGVVCLTSTVSTTATPASPGCDGLGSTYAVMIWWSENSQQRILQTAFKS